jgi:hypothetical protein
MGDQGRIAGVGDQAGDAIDDADPSVGQGQQSPPPSEVMRPPSKAALTFLRATLGKSNRRPLSSSMARAPPGFGKALVSATKTYSKQPLRYSPQPIITSGVNKTG